MQRHDTDAVSLAFGAIFLIVGVVFLTGSVSAFEFVSIWALPTTLLATGLVLAAVAIVRYRRNRQL